MRPALLFVVVLVVLLVHTLPETIGTLPTRCLSSPRQTWILWALRGGNEGDSAQAAWNPPSLRVTTSRAIHKLAERARASPTGDQVFEMAKKITPHDKALAAGPQNMSIFGHAHTIRRLHEFQDYCERLAPEAAERVGERLLRYRKRLKKWGLPTFHSDTLLAECMQANQSYCDESREIRPPNGWPLHRPAEEHAIMVGVDEELLKDPQNAMWLASKAVLRLWMGGLRPLFSEWDVRDEYAPIDAAVDEAEQLFQQSLEIDSSNPDVRCQYGKLLEAFRGDYAAAETQYQMALALDSNHIPALTFYCYFLRDLRPDTVAYRKVQGRKDMLMDPNRVHVRNSDEYFGECRDSFVCVT